MASPIDFQRGWSDATCIQRIPAILTRSSVHLLFECIIKYLITANSSLEKPVSEEYDAERAHIVREHGGGVRALVRTHCGARAGAAARAAEGRGEGHATTTAGL